MQSTTVKPSHVWSTLTVDNQLVHSPGAEGGPHCIHNAGTCCDVAQKLGFALGRICPLFDKDNWGLLKTYLENNATG